MSGILTTNAASRKYSEGDTDEVVTKNEETREEDAFNDYMSRLHSAASEHDASRASKRKRRKRKKRQNEDSSTSTSSESPLNIRVLSTEKMGRGLYATSDIASGDVLISVPLTDVVCLDTVERSDHAAVFAAVSKGTDKLALYLLSEKYKGELSRFFSWFPLMPTVFESPPFFTDAELELLRGDPLFDKALGAKTEYRRAYEHVRDHVIAKFPDAFGGENSACCTYEEYAWARHMIESRAWHLRGRQYLVPMADFFNHRPHPSQKREDYVPDVRGEFFEKHHRVSSNRAELIADRPARAGDQIFETYGDNSNFIYFMYHGFIPDENPYECVEVQLPDLFPRKPSDSDRRRMIDAVSALGLRSRDYCVKGAKSSFEVAASFMRVRSLSGDPGAIETCVHALPDAASKAWTPDLLRECVVDKGSVFDSLRAVILGMLEAYPTSMDEDLDALRSPGLGNRRRWAIRYVLERKRILNDFLAYVGGVMEKGPAGNGATRGSGEL